MRYSLGGKCAGGRCGRIGHLEPAHECGVGARPGEAGGGTVFMAIAAGRGPDVYWLSPEAIRNYRDQQLIQPLDELIAAHARKTGRPYRGIDTPWRLWQAAHESPKMADWLKWRTSQEDRYIGVVSAEEIYQRFF